MTTILGVEVSQRGRDGLLFLRVDKLRYRPILDADSGDDLSVSGWQVESGVALDALGMHWQSNRRRTAQRSGQQCAKRARQVVGMFKADRLSQMDAGHSFRLKSH